MILVSKRNETGNIPAGARSRYVVWLRLTRLVMATFVVPGLFFVPDSRACDCVSVPLRCLVSARNCFVSRVRLRRSILQICWWAGRSGNFLKLRY